MVKALVLEQQDDAVTPSIQDLPEARLEERLPEGDVTVRVEYSTLNYKDGMVLNGLGRLVRQHPHIPGVDLAGTVEASDHPDYGPGDQVLLTGWRVGELHWGGYAEKARVKAGWLVPLPEGLTSRRAMAVGTAGLAAMLAVMALEEHDLAPAKEGEVLVTGAAGGVGSVALAVLSTLGYRVVAATGREETHAYLRDLGAADIIDRAELAEPGKRPLESERWVGCVDAVGGTTLARVLAQMRYGCSVASVGLAGGNALETTVLPFLLRGVNLLGIDTVMCPFERRRSAWQRLAADLPMDKLDAMTSEARLEDLPRLGRDILQGRVRGRMVIALSP